jgi:hypothetical protein
MADVIIPDFRHAKRRNNRAFAALRTLLPAAAHPTLEHLQDICDEAHQYRCGCRMRTCHAPGADHAEARCFECHTYHDWSNRKKVTPKLTLPSLQTGSR